MQGCQDHSMWERTVFSINGAGKTGYPFAKELSWTLISHHKQITNSKWIKDLNVRHKTIKHLEENRAKLHDVKFGNDFLDMIPNTQALREKVEKLDFMKITKNFVHQTFFCA